MSVAELNFKALSTEKYRVYRLLQSPTSMVETYRARIKEVGKFRGAVIFPEQFISLYGQQVCRVMLTRDQDSVSGSVVIRRNFSLIGRDVSPKREEDKVLSTFDDVLEIEKNSGHLAKDIFKLRLQSPKVDTYYTSNSEDIKYDGTNPVYWFSNKGDALSYLRKKFVI